MLLAGSGLHSLRGDQTHLKEAPVTAAPGCCGFHQKAEQSAAPEPHRGGTVAAQHHFLCSDLENRMSHKKLCSHIEYYITGKYIQNENDVTILF